MSGEGSVGSRSSADTEAAFFDAYVSSQGDFDVFAQRAWDTLRDRFNELTGGEKFERVLDIGCGTGYSRQVYRRQTRAYCGIDLSSLAIALAASRFPSDQWQVANATSLPFGDETFDAVAFSSVLHHISEKTCATFEAFRVLRPGGFAFAFDPNVMHPAMALLRHPKSPLYSNAGVSPHERPLHESELRRAFVMAGFTSVRVRGQSNLPYRATPLRWVNALLGAYNVGDRIWESIGLGRKFGAFLVTTARKPGSATP